MCLPHVVAAGLLCVLARPLMAQTRSLECVNPARNAERCELAARSATELIILDLRLPAGSLLSGRRVSFAASSGEVTREDTTTNSGRVVARWAGDTTGLPVRIDATAIVDGESVRRTIVLGRQPPGVFTIAPTQSSNDQHGFADRRLFDRVRLRLLGDTNRCGEARVVFRAVAEGSSVPDTVRGELHEGACVATTRWKLGPTIGQQRLRAVLIGGGSYDFEANAHPAPFVASGVAFTWGQVGYDIKTTQLRVERKTRIIKATNGTDSLQIAFDDTIPTPRFDRYNPGLQVRALVGLNFPIWEGRVGSRIRLIAAVDPAAPRTDWFLGASMPSLIQKFGYEALGMDLQFGVHLAKRERLKNLDACRTDDAKCEVDNDVEFLGVSAIFVMNTNTLFSAITAALSK